MSRYMRCEFTIVDAADIPWQWCYSAIELEQTLNDICKGQRLQRILVGLHGYLESLRFDTNLLDLTYFGGGIYLVFDSVIVNMLIHADALIEYRFLQPYQVHFHNKKDSPPDDLFYRDTYYYDLKNQFELVYAGHIVSKIQITKTNIYPFDLKDFDKDKAAAAEQRNDLPSAVFLQLDNGVQVCLVGSDIEFFYIELRK